MNQNEFADEMRLRMREQRVRGRQLASLTGLSESRISEFLKGTRIPTEFQAEKIASALDWPLQDALHAAGRHRPGLDTGLDAPDSAAIAAELAVLAANLPEPARAAFYAHLRHVARSWIETSRGVSVVIGLLSTGLGPHKRRAAPNCQEIIRPFPAIIFPFSPFAAAQAARFPQLA